MREEMENLRDGGVKGLGQVRSLTLSLFLNVLLFGGAT